MADWWRGAHVNRRRWAGVAAALAVLCTVFACRMGVPVVDPSRRQDAPGTISGTVRGPDDAAAIEGRVVEIENVGNGERQQTTTNSAGGFTFKVMPGRYRVHLVLRDGERIVKAPGEMQVNTSDVDAHADFVIGGVRPARPRLAPSIEPGLAPPVA
jgi:hypothetical protein